MRPGARDDACRLMSRILLQRNNYNCLGSVDGAKPVLRYASSALSNVSHVSESSSYESLTLFLDFD